MIKRIDNWHLQLNSFLIGHGSTRFSWGSIDCCLFAADAVRAITGVDIADDFRAKYSDQASAFGLIKSVTGGSSVVDAIAHCAGKHGLAEWVGAEGQPLPLMARRGDLVAVSNAGRIIAGVVDLSGRAVACMGENGVLREPIPNIVRAWRIE